MGSYCSNADGLPVDLLPGGREEAASGSVAPLQEEHGTPRAKQQSRPHTSPTSREATSREATSREATSRGDRPHRERRPDCTSLPGGHAWLIHRAGGPFNFSLVGLMVLFNAARFELWEAAWADNKAINATSVQVVWNLASLLLALGASFFFEGPQVVDRLLNWHSFWHFIVAALLFTVAGHLVHIAMRMGASAIMVATLGYLYLPISALMSVFAFPRRYGVLEWLALAMITLATIGFLLLRERRKWLNDEGGGPAQMGTHVLDGQVHRPTETMMSRCQEGHYGLDFIQVGNTGCVLASVGISALGSILTERIYKGRALCLGENEAQYDNFYINKFHLDLASLIFSLILWSAPLSQANRIPMASTSEEWFGPWTWHQIVIVFVGIVQGWLAGLVVKRFSTVCKSIAQTLSILLAGVLGDPMMNKYDFSSRAAPTIALAVIVLMSAAIFQTGRIQSRFFDWRFTQDPMGWQSPSSVLLDKQDRFDRWGIVLSPASPMFPPSPTMFDSPTKPGRPGGRRRPWGGGSWPGSPRSPEDHQGTSTCEQRTEKFIAHCLTVVYVFIFAIENLAKQYALSKTPIVMGTMNLMTFVLGATVASCMTLWNEGAPALAKAVNPWRILKFLPCGVLFAVSQAVVFMAYALHVPASIVTVLGFVYTPVSALGKRCVLNKMTMWLQWVALLITTLASMTFGFLQHVAPAHGAEPVGLPGLLCVIVSATLAAFGSLAMEKFLKDETDSFYVQKVSLDLGSVLTSLVLLPLSGAMSHRPVDAFWRERPLGVCTDDGCWGKVGSGRTCADEVCSCECGAGLFVAWDSYLVWLTLLIVIARGWFKGVVTKKTSTLEVAIAESFGPLLIYFVGEPVLFGKNLCDWALNYVVFIAPLSAVVFQVSEQEQKTIMQHLRSSSARTRPVESNSEDEQRLCPLEAFLEDLGSAAEPDSPEEEESGTDTEEPLVAE